MESIIVFIPEKLQFKGIDSIECTLFWRNLCDIFILARRATNITRNV